MISLVVAAARNGVIGDGGELPWRLPDDLRRFKALTMGKPIIMGRKTWDSIGRPLPGRQNIVLTRQQDFSATGVSIAHSPATALRAAGDADEIMIIGGAEIYALFRQQAERLYLTVVDAELNGDARFLLPDENTWELVDAEPHGADDSHPYAFEFRTYRRRGRS